MKLLAFALAASSSALVACSSGSSTTTDAVPADGSYLSAEGYALTIAQSAFTLTSFDAQGQAVVKSGTLDWGTTGVLSLVYTKSSCTPDDVGVPVEYDYAEFGGGFVIDLPSGASTFVLGTAPAGLVAGCYVHGVFAPSGSK